MLINLRHQVETLNSELLGEEFHFRQDYMEHFLVVRGNTRANIYVTEDKFNLDVP
jgi:hypothetical protein